MLRSDWLSYHYVICSEKSRLFGGKNIYIFDQLVKFY